MRRTAKILAIVLAVVLLIGMLSVFASAASHPVTTITGTGITHRGDVNYDFESETMNDFDVHWNSEDAHPHTGFWNNIKSTGFAHYSSRCSCHKNNSKDCPNVKEGISPENTYAALWYDKIEAKGEDKTVTTGEPNGQTAYIDLLGQYTQSTLNIATMSYQVWDFDITSDRYLDASGNLTTEETDSDGNPNPLAFLTGYSWYFHVRDGSGGANIKFKCDSTGNYIIFNGVEAPLTIKAGEWAHVTAVIAFDHSAISNSKIYYYLDGDFIASGSIITASSDTSKTYISAIRMELPRLKGINIKSFSESFDNATVHNYSRDYSGPLSEAFSPTTHPEKIGAYFDMVYNYDYQYSTPNKPLASITTGEGETAVTTNHYTIDSLLANIVEGCTLTLKNGTKLLGCDPACNFKVVCPEGDFSLKSTHNKAFAWIEEGGYYQVSDAGSQVANISFFSTSANAEANGTPDLGFDGFTVPFGQLFDLPTANETGIIDMIPTESNGYTFKTFAAWKAFAFDENGENPTEYDLSKAPTSEKKYINVYPVYDEGTLIYGVFDKNGVKRDSLGGYTQYTKPEVIATEVRAQIDAGLLDVYLKLVDDVIVDDFATGFNLAKNTSPQLYLNLNGHTLALSSRDYAREAFTFGWGAAVHIYSTQENGRLFHSSATGSAALVSITGGNTINLGRIQDPLSGEFADGDNLSIYAEQLLYHNGRYKAGIVIDGGHYYNFDGTGVAFVPILNNTLFNAKNAKFYTESRPLLSTNKNKLVYTATDLKDNSIGFYVDIDNCQIIAGADGKGNIFGEIYKGGNINITNSELYGSMQLSSRTSGTDENALLGTVTLGSGVKFTDTAAYTHIVHPKTYVSLPYSGSNDPLTFNYYKIVYENKLPAEGTFDTPIAVSTELPLAREVAVGVSVTFKNADGTVIDTVAVAIGGTVTAPEVVTDIANPFFKLALAWVDADGTEIDLTALAAGSHTAIAQLTPVADLSEVKMNVFASTKFMPYIYIPIPDENGYDGYTVKLADAYISLDTIEYRGMEYYRLPIDTNTLVTPTNGGTAVEYPITFTVTNGDISTELTSSVLTKTLPEYFSAAMEAETTDEVGKELIMAMVGYCKAALEANATEETPYTALKNAYTAILENSSYSSYITNIEDYADDIEKEADAAVISTLSSYVDATYVISDTALPFFVLTNRENIAISPNDASGKQLIYATGNNCYYTYGDFGGETVTVSLYENSSAYDYAGKRFGADNNGCVSGASFIYNFNETVPAYALCLNMNITLTVLPEGAVTEGSIDESGAVTYTGTYNLAAYIESVRAQNDETATSVAEALYVYSRAALTYMRTPEAGTESSGMQ